MQLLVKGFDGRTRVLDGHNDSSTVWEVKEQLQALTGVPAEEQCLRWNGRPLADQQTLLAAGLTGHDTATLQMTCPLAGGAPVKVQVLPQGLPCGPEVTLDIEADTPLLEVKRQLQLATGMPIEHQKVMLSAINQIVLGDKRTMKFAHCGTASSLYFAVAPKQQQ
eukprot:GHRR01006098.1.p1 GENE.GHRR01006098.1~~GHRR01006098.1.p1  ORF type:complete len:165 (+),score=57.87 GHRR01006098.1:273-767(+)